MSQDDQERPQRPLRIRRGFQNRGIANSTEAAGARQEGESDEADEIIDVEPNLNASVRAQAAQTFPALPHALPAIPPAPGTRQSPAERLRSVRTRATEYEKEFRLRLVHKLVLEGHTVIEIADILEISERQVNRCKQELAQRFREESRQLDIDFLVGEGQAFYDHVMQAALKIAGDDRNPSAMKLAALRTAMGGNADKHRFLTATGVYNAMQYKKVTDAAEKSDIQTLLEATNRIFGVEGFNLNDKDASNNDEENIEL